MMSRVNGNNACAASAYAEASFSCADKVNTVNLGAIIMASIIICRVSARRLCVLLAEEMIEAAAKVNMAVRTAAA